METRSEKKIDTTRKDITAKKNEKTDKMYTLCVSLQRINVDLSIKTGQIVLLNGNGSDNVHVSIFNVHQHLFGCILFHISISIFADD